MWGGVELQQNSHSQFILARAFSIILYLFRSSLTGGLSTMNKSPTPISNLPTLWIKDKVLKRQTDQIN